MLRLRQGHSDNLARGPRLTLTFSNTYSLDAHHQMRHLVPPLGYSEDTTTSQQQLRRLPPADLGDFPYQLWAGRIPDPLLRIQVINACLRHSQLQGPNAGNVDYLSHDYFLRKQRQHAVLYPAPKRTLALGPSRQLRPKLSASVDPRRSWHASGAYAGYREHGAATLSVLF